MSAEQNGAEEPLAPIDLVFRAILIQISKDPSKKSRCFLAVPTEPLGKTLPDGEARSWTVLEEVYVKAEPQTGYVLCRFTPPEGQEVIKGDSVLVLPETEAMWKLVTHLMMVESIMRFANRTIRFQKENMEKMRKCLRALPHLLTAARIQTDKKAVESFFDGIMGIVEYILSLANR
jgi:hypothetical protein